MNEYLKEAFLKHNANLSPYACQDADALYLKEEPDDIRPPFFHDIDRIIYSLGFIRYQSKTQVFSFQKHDHLSRRMVHVQFVSKIARTIGRALNLNEDLIEASSLGHDLGHVPFGHTGESILNEISLNHQAGYFNHNVESVRDLLYIENYGQGLNITVQVLDAILCHNGEFPLGKYEPIKKTKEEFLKEYELSYQDKSVLANIKPMSLEGCVVRVSDLIAYLGRDIDDAIRLNLIKREDIPQSITTVLGNNTKDIVNTCVLDIIKNSYQKNYIMFSNEVFKAIKELQKFNYENIYYKALAKEDIATLKEMFNTLFDTYLNDLKTHNEASPFIYSYLKNMHPEYQKNNSDVRLVIDYIAGMTDNFFIDEYKRIRAK